MSDNRDFKGVWIPKEIWLNEELTMLEKVIFVEIDSLDNEEHCVAGNNYLAEFCGCSERKVSDAIKKLESLGYIEVMSFDGRHRKIRVVKNAEETRKICEAESNNLQSNNIYNSKSKISKDILDNKEEFLGSAVKKSKGKSMFQKCVDMVNDYTDDNMIRNLLIQYLKLRLEMGDLQYANMWKGMLNKLSNISGDKAEIIQQSIDRGYRSFFPIKSYNKDVFSECGEVHSYDNNRKEVNKSNGAY